MSITNTNNEVAMAVDATAAAAEPNEAATLLAIELAATKSHSMTFEPPVFETGTYLPTAVSFGQRVHNRPPTREECIALLDYLLAVGLDKNDPVSVLAVSGAAKLYRLAGQVVPSNWVEVTGNNPVRQDHVHELFPAFASPSSCLEHAAKLQQKISAKYPGVELNEIRAMSYEVCGLMGDQDKKRKAAMALSGLRATRKPAPVAAAPVATAPVATVPVARNETPVKALFGRIFGGKEV